MGKGTTLAIEMDGAFPPFFEACVYFKVPDGVISAPSDAVLHLGLSFICVSVAHLV